MNKLKSVLFSLLTITTFTLFLTSCEKNTPIPEVEEEHIQNCTQTINLNNGWNLISFDVSLKDHKISTIFSDLIDSGNLQYISGYESNALIYDPNQQDFLNTLESINDGSGYWVKILNDAALTVEGECIDENFRKPWNSGWNLTAYIPNDSQTPSEYFSQELSNNELMFVTGFENGTVSFDPDNPVFLNTLKLMKNGFGYWVNLKAATGKTVQNQTNIFSFINGTTNLPTDEVVDVLNQEGEVVASLKVIEGNYLMTTPIYGDLTTTTFKEGLSKGETLKFRWNNQIADITTTFKGDYSLENINIEFENAKP